MSTSETMEERPSTPSSILYERLVPVPEAEDARQSFQDSVEIDNSPIQNEDPQPVVPPLKLSIKSLPPSATGSVCEYMDDESQDPDASRSSALSIGSGQSSSRKKRLHMEEIVEQSKISRSQDASRQSSQDIGVDYNFPADRIFEYQWPNGSEENYVLQEQISEYLGIKSFKRKYPNLKRRQVEIEERNFLTEKGVVTETQCDLGLTALKADDVMDIMSKDYPTKYSEYVNALDNRRLSNYSSRITKNYQTATVEKNKMKEFLKKAIKSANEYNIRLNAERKEERQVSMDLQTYTIHYPCGLGRDNRMLQRNIRNGLVNQSKVPGGKYPIALIPGQYQDSYMKYTPDELKYLPLGSVIYGPIVTDPTKLPPLLTSAEDGSPSDSDSESLPTDEDEEECEEDGEQKDVDEKNKREETCSSSSSSDSEVEGPPPLPTLMNKSWKDKPFAVCKVCKSGSAFVVSLQGPEELVHCSECDNSSHPSCLQLTLEIVDVIKSYPWQCMDCKTCVHCSQPHNEDKMMFCDKCDRGYHTFCVGLKSIPTGKWVCRLCAQCAQCGHTRPGSAVLGDAMVAEWQHETIKIISPNGETLRRHQLLCVQCYKQRRPALASN